MKNTTRWFAPAVAAGLLFAGCSKNADPTTTAGAGGSSSSTAPTAAAPTTTAGGAKGSATTSGGGYGDGYKTSTTGATAAGGATTTTGATTGASTTAASGVPHNGVTVNKATAAIGDIAVDANGMTLYAFKKDTGAESTCTGGCTSAWPPFVGPVETAGTGIQLASLSTTTRTDGTRQVTYKGHPLYHFSGDTKPGDTNGHGVADIWYAMGADGNALPKK